MLSNHYQPARQDSEEEPVAAKKSRGSIDGAPQSSRDRQETGDTLGSGYTCETSDSQDLPPPARPSIITPTFNTLPKLTAGNQRALHPRQAISRDLKPWQIFFIVISGTIGLGLFTDSGEILRLAGPCGGLVAFFVVSLLVISIMAGIAEMINHWPISAALVEFVRSFIDDDLAIILGIAYWLAYSITFGTLISALLDLGSYWAWARIWQTIVFGILAPALAVAINCFGVKIYGYVESIMGILKLVLVLGIFIFMFVINAGGGKRGEIGSKYISEGFKSDVRITSSPFIALLAGIPIAAYSFVGVEIVAVTALEAKDPANSLKWPAKSVATILTFGYLFSVLSYYLNVSWEDESLPSMFSRSSRDATLGKSIIMIATTNSGIPIAPGFLNVCLIGAVFSAANTTLYVASRTLFGIAKGLDPRNEDSWLERKLSCFGATNPNSKVPQRAVILSVCCGIWLAWVHVGSNFNDQWLQQIMSGVATNSIILVWASQCLAFINYRNCLDLHSEKLTAGFSYLENTQLNSGPLSHLQPSLAWAGLFGCLVTIFFSTAGWWQWAKPSVSDILATWTVPFLVIFTWTVMKTLSTGDNPWGLKRNRDWKDLKRQLTRLEDLTHKIHSVSDAGGEETVRSRWLDNVEISQSPDDPFSRSSFRQAPTADESLEDRIQEL